MGCFSSKEATSTKSMLNAFLPDEQTALLSALDSSKSTGNIVQLRSKYPFVPESFLVALNSYISSYGAFGEASLSSAIYNLRTMPAEREKFFQQGYKPNHADGVAATRKFVQDLGNVSMGFYPQPNPATKPVSQRFLDFVLAPKIGADAKQVDFPDSPPNNVYVNNLWKLAIERLFLTDPSRLVRSDAAFLTRSQKDDAENTARTKGLKGPTLEYPSQLLAAEDVWLLDNHIPADHKTSAWQCCFDKTRNGMSWTVFQTSVEGRGSTLLVFKDSKGYVFGGFASQEWKQQPKWFGDSSSFLFRLQPDVYIFPATGYNQNFQWFEYGTQSMPNGLGMGGQADYYALWISANDFYSGHSKGNPSTTFNSFGLAGTEEFRLEYVEAWMVKEKYVDPNLLPERKGKKSVLDNAEESMLLEMAGRKMYSKDVRAADAQQKKDDQLGAPQDLSDSHS